MWGTIANWASAVGTVAAVVVAIVLWREDRFRERTEAARLRTERMERLVVSLREEIAQAVKGAERNQRAAERILGLIGEGQGPAVSGGRIAPGTLAIPDGVIYRAVVADLGYLPTSILSELVKFYTYAGDVVRTAELAPSWRDGYATLIALSPRVRMSGNALLLMLEKFAGADFSPAANVKLTEQEMRDIACRSGYPPDELPVDA